MHLEMWLVIVFLIVSFLGIGGSLLVGGELGYGFFGFNLNSIGGVIVYGLIMAWILVGIYSIFAKKKWSYYVVVGYLAFMFLNELINLIVFWNASVLFFVKLVVYVVFIWLLKNNKGWFLF